MQGRAKKKKGWFDYVTDAVSFVPVVGQAVGTVKGMVGGGSEQPEDMGTVVGGTSQPKYITDEERKRYSYY
jgi:hypothetical protein